MLTQLSVKERILEAVTARDYYQNEYPDWNGKDNLPCPVASKRHEGGDDDRPSFNINPETGAFNCHACGFKGTSLVGYHTDVHCGGDIRKALATLYAKYIGSVVSNADIKEFHKALLSRKAVLRRLLMKRRWSVETIKKLRLGWNTRTKRVTIPVYTGAKFAVDIREHDSIYVAPKRDGHRITMLANKKANGKFYPIVPSYNPFNVDNTEIWIVEGEPDAISMVEHGINAVTVTGGVEGLISMGPSSLVAFNGKHVILCLDNDDAGKRATKALCEKFAATDIASLKVVPPPEGKDITDYFVKYGGSGVLLKQCAALENYLIAPRKKHTQALPLAAVSDAKFLGTDVICDVLVNGKHRSPFNIPKRVEFSCTKEEKCDACPTNTLTGTAEHFITQDDENLLNWLINKPKTALRSEYEMSPRCPVKVRVTEWQTVEAITMIPSLSISSSDDADKYCQRTGYYLGHGIETNQPYRITATPTVAPRTNESVLLVKDTENTYDSLEGFKLSDDEVERLKGLTSMPPGKLLRSVADMFAHNVTKIYDRWDLHAAVDLAFHSVSDFSFAGTQLPKGSIELLLFGDTRCGKGQVAEGLAKFYDLGSVVSGESSSFMGLLGGASKVGDSFQLVWGAIPINNRRLVIIDEFSGLGSAEMGKLSRIRSEGIAELNKGGIHASTRANARLIWIANPRGGKPVSSFSSGASAILDLVKAQEDVARFDLAFVVQRDEVDSSIINTIHREISTAFERVDLRKLLLWTWSRKPEQVYFTDEATSFILQNAQRLAERYSSTVPLVQAENVRFKVAKLAAALAARTFSTDDGVNLKVTKQHASVAIKFLRHCYDKPSMGYRVHSALERDAGKLTSKTELIQWVDQFDEHTRSMLINGLLETDKISRSDIEDWTDHPPERCKKHLGLLVRWHALKPLGRGIYEKRSAFIKLLKGLR